MFGPNPLTDVFVLASLNKENSRRFPALAEFVWSMGVHTGSGSIPHETQDTPLATFEDVQQSLCALD